jgi:hypothetical protein
VQQIFRRFWSVTRLLDLGLVGLVVGIIPHQVARPVVG